MCVASFITSVPFFRTYTYLFFLCPDRRLHIPVQAAAERSRRTNQRFDRAPGRANVGHDHGQEHGRHRVSGGSAGRAGPLLMSRAVHSGAERSTQERVLGPALCTRARVVRFLASGVLHLFPLPLRCTETALVVCSGVLPVLFCFVLFVMFRRVFRRERERTRRDLVFVFLFF